MPSVYAGGRGALGPFQTLTAPLLIGVDYQVPCVSQIHAHPSRLRFHRIVGPLTRAYVYCDAHPPVVGPKGALECTESLTKARKRSAESP